MMARPPREVLALDMPFEEALERYVGVKPKEFMRNVERAKKKKLPTKKAKKMRKPAPKKHHVRKR